MSSPVPKRSPRDDSEKVEMTNVRAFRAAASSTPQMKRMEEQSVIDRARKKAMDSHGRRYRTEEVWRSVAALSAEVESTKAELTDSEEDLTEVQPSSEAVEGSMKIGELLSSAWPRGSAFEKSFVAAQKAKEMLQSPYRTHHSGIQIRQTRRPVSRLSKSVDLRSIKGVSEHIARRRRKETPPEPPMERAVLPNPPALTPSVASVSLRLSCVIDQILTRGD
jgi:hypothetical protein